jgi:multidrug efflux pump subunit AcrB
MWIVKIALRRPYTFVVLALLILIVGPLAILLEPSCAWVLPRPTVFWLSVSPRNALAKEQTPLQAALDAGFTRFRPVLMTALAMIIGMVPLALGLGEGGEQNAPLGRAVIGGLILATIATLFFVPALFSLLHGSQRHEV